MAVMKLDVYICSVGRCRLEKAMLNWSVFTLYEVHERGAGWGRKVSGSKGSFDMAWLT